MADSTIVPPLRVASDAAVLPLRYKLQLIGAGVSLADDPVGQQTVATITGGGTGGGGGTTLPSQAGNSGKVLGTDGTALSWVTQSGGGSATEVFFSTARYLAAKGGGSATGGNYSTGAQFTFDKSAHVTGARWSQAAGSSSALVSLWSLSSGGAATRIASVTVISPSSTVPNEATFSSSVTVTAGVTYVLTVYDGSYQLLYQGATTPGSLGGYAWGPAVYCLGFGYVSGDNGQLAIGGQYSGIDPLYTVP